MHYGSGGNFLPKGADGTPDYNITIPMLLVKYLPTGLLGVGFTALMASFMSGMAGNVTAFNTVWTYDIYQSYMAPGKSDSIISGWAAGRPCRHHREHRLRLPGFQIQ